VWPFKRQAIVGLESSQDGWTFCLPVVVDQAPLVLLEEAAAIQPDPMLFCDV
jgi:hypothetical protein